MMNKTEATSGNGIIKIEGTRYAALPFTHKGRELAELAFLRYFDGTRTWEPCERSPFTGTIAQVADEARRREEWIAAHSGRKS